MPGTVLGPGNQYNEQDRYGSCSPRAYSVGGKAKIKHNHNEV